MIGEMIMPGLFQEQVPEPAPGGGGIPAVGDAVPVAPAAPPAPAAPAVPVAPTAPVASPEPVQLTRDMMIQMAGEDGLPDGASLGDMADLYRRMKKHGLVSPEKLEQFDQVQKVLAGDQEATRALFESQFPKSEPLTPEAETLATLQRTVEDLKAQVDGRLGPGLQGIQTQNELKGLSEYLQVNGATFPFLARNPQGANMVHGQLQQIQEQVRTQYKTEFSTLSQQQQLQLLQGAFTTCEANLKNLVELYYPSATPPAPGSQIHPVNDQVSGVNSTASSGRWALDPRTGIPIVPKLTVPGAPEVRPPGVAEVPAGAPLSSTPITALPTGQPAGLTGAPVASGPFTKEGLAQKIAARTQQVL